MSLKDELKRLRKKLMDVDVATEDNTSKVNDKKFEPAYLDDEINDFLKWYYDTFVYESVRGFENNYFTKRMRDFIEKMAIWYELRYPDYSVNQLMPGCGQEEKNVSDIMFKDNQYLKEKIRDNSFIQDLDWSEFYNTNSFIKSLPWDERRFFLKPQYKDIVYLKPGFSPHLHLTKKGFVTISEGVSLYTHSTIRDEEVVGLHLKQVVQLFRERGIPLSYGNEFERAILDVNNQKRLKDELLNCVMYRIIERGGNRIGPRRAFLFAKEFDRNIDIPMIYGVDFTDPGLRSFLNNYLKAGGYPDLKCYVGYFDNVRKKEDLDMISVRDLLLIQPYNATTFYTPEEQELQQRFAHALSTQIDSDDLVKERAKQLRIKRKSEKSKKNN